MDLKFMDESQAAFEALCEDTSLMMNALKDRYQEKMTDSYEWSMLKFMGDRIGEKLIGTNGGADEQDNLNREIQIFPSLEMLANLQADLEQDRQTLLDKSNEMFASFKAEIQEVINRRTISFLLTHFKSFEIELENQNPEPIDETANSSNNENPEINENILDLSEGDDNFDQEMAPPDDSGLESDYHSELVDVAQNGFNNVHEDAMDEEDGDYEYNEDDYVIIDYWPPVDGHEYSN